MDHLDFIEGAVPGLKGRMDHQNIAIAGHSFGAHTAAAILGAKINISGESAADFRDDRIKAGILLSAAGRGGEALSEFATQHFSYLNLDYTSLLVPTLVVAGDKDQSPLTVLGPEWFTEAFFLSPGADALLTLFGGEHMLGGISGYLVRETTDENPGRVSMVQLVTTAYLQRTLSNNNVLWDEVYDKLSEKGSEQGEIQIN